MRKDYAIYDFTRNSFTPVWKGLTLERGISTFLQLYKRHGGTMVTPVELYENSAIGVCGLEAEADPVVNYPILGILQEAEQTATVLLCREYPGGTK